MESGSFRMTVKVGAVKAAGKAASSAGGGETSSAQLLPTEVFVPLLQYTGDGFVATASADVRLELADFTADGRAKLLRCWAKPAAEGSSYTYELRVERRGGGAKQASSKKKKSRW
jgi:hypothetical protein